MVFRILIDLSHYETIQKIPDQFFQSEEYIFFFNSVGSNIADFEALQQYNLIIFGNPQPKYLDERLFTSPELKSLKKYVKLGGKLLITTSNRGDFNREKLSGSLRVLYNLTGIMQYAYALNYIKDPDQFIEKKSNLIIRDFPSHPIFEGFNNDEDHLVFGNSTYLILHPEISSYVLLTTPKRTWSHYYATKQKNELGSQPILVYRTYFEGLVVVLGSSSFLTKDSINGIGAGSNGKFARNLFGWMLNQ
ncbi:MAG: hypothetical protein ACTSVZ_01170 [Promethearchaeota archaeon]